MLSPTDVYKRQGVGVQREARRVVTQHTADGLDVHAVLERHGREGVTEIVESNARQPLSLIHIYPDLTLVFG